MPISAIAAIRSTNASPKMKIGATNAAKASQPIT